MFAPALNLGFGRCTRSNIKKETKENYTTRSMNSIITFYSLLFYLCNIGIWKSGPSDKENKRGWLVRKTNWNDFHNEAPVNYLLAVWTNVGFTVLFVSISILELLLNIVDRYEQIFILYYECNELFIFRMFEDDIRVCQYGDYSRSTRLFSLFVDAKRKL